MLSAFVWHRSDGGSNARLHGLMVLKIIENAPTFVAGAFLLIGIALGAWIWLR